jgi:hypothetical protein
MNITHASLPHRIWTSIDQEARGRLRDGRVVTDHRASATANLQASVDAFGGIGSSWAAVARGESILGGGHPRDRVAAAQGPLRKASTALAQHGGNAAMAAVLTVQGSIGGVVDAAHGAVHGVLGALQRPGA